METNINKEKLAKRMCTEFCCVLLKVVYIIGNFFKQGESNYTPLIVAWRSMDWKQELLITHFNENNNDNDNA